MSRHIKISRKGFICYYCGKKRKGAYSIVDENKSCEKCNRAYDYVSTQTKVKCPVCNGAGYFDCKSTL